MRWRAERVISSRDGSMIDESWVGQTFAGKYRVEKILGKGGMGLVLGARHLKLDEPVAIKVLRPTMLEIPGMATRFLREARAAWKIKSVHVVRVTDVDTLEDGTPFMVMEYLEGIDLLDLKRDRGTFGVAEAVGHVLQACDAIAEAHSLGIVHRDLKPANLFLHRYKDGRCVIKVLDFGISKLEAPGEMDSTKTGQMMGSPKYMSPEQMLSMRDVDRRSDIWSLGAILYELLAGRPPFVADTTPRVCALVLHADPALPSALRPDLPIELERAVMRCLQKEPNRRFASVAELVDALSAFAPPPDASVTRSGGAFPVPSLLGSTPPPSGTPAPITLDERPARRAAGDAETRLEGAPRRGGSRRLAALLFAAAVVVVLVAIYVTQRRSAVAAQTPADSASAVQAAPAATPTADPSSKAYSPSDLPEAHPTAAPRPVAPPSSALPSAPGSPGKTPKHGHSDPFGGRRN
jgi:serine/threonine-protein kinase